MWSEWRALVPRTDQGDAVVVRRLQQAIDEAAPNGYQESYEELVRLKNLEPDLMVRRKLLARLGAGCSSLGLRNSESAPASLNP